MRLIGKDKIQGILTADEHTSKWVKAWVSELTNANWKQPDDVNKQFPNTRITMDGQFVFPITSCNKEVYLKIAFQQSIAIITGLQ